jgi:hypothetical protein
MCCTKRTAASIRWLSATRSLECQADDTPASRLASGGLSSDGVWPGPAGDNRLSLCKLVLVTLLPDEEAHARRHLTNAVTDGQVEGIRLKNDFLEVG